MNATRSAAEMLLLATLVIEAPTGVRAQLDPTFGDGGVVHTALVGDAFAYGVVIDADGKVVVGGFTHNGAPPTPTPAVAPVTRDDFLLVRYNADGSLDSNFGHDGIVTAALTDADDLGFALVAQPDGKLVVAGICCDDHCGMALARFNIDGSRDGSFGDGGQVITRLADANAAAYALAIQPDGKLVVAGSDHSAFLLVRYHPDGSLDASFGENGVVRTSLKPSGAWARALVVDPDGDIVAAGYACGDTCAFALARYRANGQLDLSFGNGGIAVTDLGTRSGIAHALVRQPDGKLIAGGANDRDIVLVRYTADGGLDLSFAQRGIATISVNDGYDAVNALALQPDGKLLAAGFVAPFNPQQGGLALMRFTSDGRLDPSFGSNGVVAGWLSASAEAIALQSDGAVVAAGHGFVNDKHDIVVVRYANDDGAPSPEATPLPTPTPTPTAATGTVAVAIDLSDASAHPGAAVTISATLASHGLAVAGVQNDLVFDPAVMDLVSSGSCRINPAIAETATGCEASSPIAPCKSFFHASHSCADRFDCPDGAHHRQLFRVIIYSQTNVNPIPDGELYSCTFLTHGGEGTFVIENRNLAASTSDGWPLLTVGRNSVVTLTGLSTTPVGPTATATPASTARAPGAVATATPRHAGVNSPAATLAAPPSDGTTFVARPQSARGSSGRSGCTAASGASEFDALLLVLVLLFRRRRAAFSRRSSL